MGFNVAGLVIDKDYQQDLPSLERILGVRLVPEGEVSYEEASENYKEGDYCDVYFCEQGTIVYTNVEFTLGKYVAKGQKVLAFTWYEISDAFYLRYSEDGMVKRTKMVAEGEVSLDEGEPLPEELHLAAQPKPTDEEDWGEMDNTPEVIEALFESLIGMSIYAVEPDCKCYRYRMLREGEKLEVKEAKEEATQSVRLGSYTPSEDLMQRQEQEGKKVVFLFILLLICLGIYLFFSA